MKTDGYNRAGSGLARCPDRAAAAWVCSASSTPLKGIGRLRPAVPRYDGWCERLRRVLVREMLFDRPDAMRVGVVKIARFVEIVVVDEILEAGLVGFGDRRIWR